MQVSTRLGEQIESYLDLSSAELKTTAGNMANIDTPGYKTQGFDFNHAMQAALLPDETASTLAGRAFTGPRVEDIDGLIERPDGNNVSMDREGLKMAEAQLKFRTGVELIKREYTRVLDAIHADNK